MTSSLQKWPNNWDKHISKYCDLYFCDKDIKYLSKNFWTETFTNKPYDLKVTSINIKFQIEDYHYLVNISNDKNNFSCNVFYKRLLNTIFNEQNNTFICCPEDISSLQELSGIGGYNITVLCLMEFVEKVILNDYSQRRNNDWDNENEEDVPIEPIAPTEVVEPELMLT